MMKRRRQLYCEQFEARLYLDGAGIADVADFAEGEPEPGFSLPDVNSTSPSFGQDVSPSDHLGHASAWYFGHAT